MRFPTKLHDTLNPVSLSLCSMCQAFQRCYTSFTTLNGYESLSLSLLHCCAIVPALRTLPWPHSRPPVSVSVTTSRVSSSGEPTFHVSSTQKRLPSSSSFPLVGIYYSPCDASTSTERFAEWSLHAPQFLLQHVQHLFDVFSDIFRTLRCCFYNG